MHGEMMDDSEHPIAPSDEEKGASRFDERMFDKDADLRSEVRVFSKEHSILATEQLQTQKSLKKRAVLIVLAAVVVLMILVGIGWLAFANRGGSGENVNETTTEGVSDGDADKDENLDDEPTPENEVVALSVDDELVQRVYGQFDFDLFSQFIWPTLFQDVNDDEKIAFAIASNTQTHMCKERYGDLYGDGEYDLSSFAEPWLVSGESCVAGSKVLDIVEKVFGSKIALKNKQIVGFYCHVYVYDEKNDEFIDLESGCSGPSTSLIRGLYAAEKIGERLFLYEVATYSMHRAFADGSWESDNPSTGKVYYLLDANGSIADSREYILKDTEIDDSNISQYKDEFSNFKWTFRWNGENYVFENLERI